MKTRIAVPSVRPGGLDAKVDDHFGHCDMYTLVVLDNGEVETVEMIPNMPHQQGGCMATVNYLASNGVNKLVAGGLGRGPLMGFHQAGIDVYHGGGAPTVGHAVQAIIDGALSQFRLDQTCKGNCGHHHGN